MAANYASALPQATPDGQPIRYISPSTPIKTLVQRVQHGSPSYDGSFLTEGDYASLIKAVFDQPKELARYGLDVKNPAFLAAFPEIQAMTGKHLTEEDVMRSFYSRQDGAGALYATYEGALKNFKKGIMPDSTLELTALYLVQTIYDNLDAVRQHKGDKALSNKQWEFYNAARNLVSNIGADYVMFPEGEQYTQAGVMETLRALMTAEGRQAIWNDIKPKGRNRSRPAQDSWSGGDLGLSFPGGLELIAAGADGYEHPGPYLMSVGQQAGHLPGVSPKRGGQRYSALAVGLAIGTAVFIVIGSAIYLVAQSGAAPSAPQPTFVPPDQQTNGSGAGSATQLPAATATHTPLPATQTSVPPTSTTIPATPTPGYVDSGINFWLPALQLKCDVGTIGNNTYMQVLPDTCSYPDASGTMHTGQSMPSLFN
ncbi:MAG: hypothetical protein HGA85_02275, partial [Nanoarchaeota archaeon]|nr:hypothetical protein [Nanoarchaeota archaeon]